MLAGIFEITALPLTWFYSFTQNYAIAIGIVAVFGSVWRPRCASCRPITGPIVRSSTKR
jgi:hypothetical protein